MEAPAKEIIEKAADVVESVGAVVTKRKRKRTRSPTTSVPSTVLAGAQASAGTAILNGVYLTRP